MDRAEFERDLGAWIDGALPPERAEAMRSARDASPELAARAAAERRLHDRVAKAMASDFARDEDVDEAVRAMIARARSGRAPAARPPVALRAAWRAVAATLLVVAAGAWWFCVPPFDCAYMEALEAASHDHAATPGPGADESASQFRLPATLDGAVAAPPAAETILDIHGARREGVRLDYVRPDGVTALHVVALDSFMLRPSIRRRVERDGEVWWTRVHAGERTWAFRSEHTDVLYSVTGREADDGTVFAAAKALREGVR